MIKTIDISKFKTGLDIEKEINRLILLAMNYEISHIIARERIDELFDYGKESKKFPKSDVDFYMKRRNCHRDGRPRTHLEFGLDLRKSQKKEHKVFLYFIDYLKKDGIKEVTWELYGSDLDGYLKIINYHGKSKTSYSDPDYLVHKEDRDYLIEAKSFETPPTFKIANLIKYKELKSYIVLKYLGKYYLFGSKAINLLFKEKRIQIHEQDGVMIDQVFIDKLIKNNEAKRVIC